MTTQGEDISKAIVQVIKNESVIYRDLLTKVTALCGCHPESIKRRLKILRDEGYISKSGKYFEWHEVPLEIDPSLERKVIVKRSVDCKVNFDRSYWTSLRQLA